MAAKIASLNFAVIMLRLLGSCFSQPTLDCDYLPAVSTDLEYYYRYLPDPVTLGRFHFQVKASNDAHIALSPTRNNPFDLYEIVISGWSNSKSAIRRCMQCDNKVTTQTPSYLSSHQLRSFWISYDLGTGKIQVGKYGQINAFMQWTDPSPLKVKYVGYSTGWGSAGTFLFCTVAASPVRVCKNHQFSLDCGFEFIDVKWALYGRENDSTVCQTSTEQPACGEAATSLDKVKSVCQGAHQCDFSITDEVFGNDPCQDDGTYLTVEYACSEQATVYFCQSETFAVTCGTEFIDVKFALYGRESNANDVCHINETATCGNETASLSRVKGICQWAHNCSFLVSDYSFGVSPCVSPYMAVEYSCVPRVCDSFMYAYIAKGSSFSSCPLNRAIEIWRGTYFTMKCRSTSSGPPSRINWFENGSTRNSTYALSWEQTGYFYEVSQMIRFRINSKREAVYTCCGILADHGPDCLGDSCASCKFVVSYQDFSIAKSPTTPVREGDTVTLKCIVDAYPTFTGWIQWFHSPTRDKKLSISGPEEIFENGTLGLTNIKWDQAGWYECAGGLSWIGSNGKPSDTSGPIDVTVHYAAVIFDKGQTWIGANEGHAATLECSVRANPLPTVTWYGPENITVTNETSPGRISLEDTITGMKVTGYRIDSRLNINSVRTGEDYGLYKCQASNGIGKIGEYEIHLSERGRPDPPLNLKVLHVSESASTVVWEPGYDGGEMQSFRVNSRKIAESFQDNAWVEISADVCVYSFVGQAYILYEVAVYGVNKHGASQYATIQVRLLPNTPNVYGIGVRYDPSKDSVKISGIPQDGDSKSCLRLEKLDHFHKNLPSQWESIGEEFDCLKQDGEYMFDDFHVEKVRSRYCRDGLCSRPSAAINSALLPLMSTQDPKSNHNTSPPDDSQPLGGANVTLIMLCTSGGLMLSFVFMVACFFQRHLVCGKYHPQSHTRRNSTQPNGIEAFYPVADAPPPYEEALEMAPVSNDDPPPQYVYPDGSTETASSTEYDDEPHELHG